MTHWRKSWPRKAYRFVRDIIKSNLQLSAMLVIAIEKGIERQNFLIIDTLVPLMNEEARLIYDKCGAILDCLPGDRRGRLPAWVVETREMEELAINLIRQTMMIPDYAKSGKYLVVERLLTLAQETNGRIAGKLNSIPRDPSDEWDTRRLLEEVFSDDRSDQ